MFGNIGLPELILIFIIALLIFGPKKLPELGKTIGRALAEFRKTTSEIKNSIEEEIRSIEVKDLEIDLDRELEKENEEEKKPQ
ncbi:MAG: Sec-independent protein translocase protein TatB [Acidobacteriota bacterium]